MSICRRPACYQPRGGVSAAQISKLHEEVSRVLWAMGVFHVDDAITPDGLFCVDIALEGEKARPPRRSRASALRRRARPAMRWPSRSRCIRD